MVTPEIVSEAAVWVSRLHGPDRSIAMERECLAWQARSAAHRLAFERCTDTWQDVAGLTLSTYAAAARQRPPDPPMAWRATRRAALTCAVLAGAGLFAWHPWAQEDPYDTGVGEQRVVMLADGSRMTLNTATRVQVALTKAQRTVKVLGGEALFEVAKDPGRPFVVQVADANVVATGTAFLVRATSDGKTEGDAFGVTLIEGQVVVRRSGNAAQSMLSAPLVMAPGERLRVRRSNDRSASRESSSVRVDRPKVDQITAWQRGEVVFDDAPLPDAVVEMNRYSKVPIDIVTADALAALRVSGVFRTGDSDPFARALARLHGLVVRDRGSRLELASK